jgi:hypothetical protein
MAHQEHAGGLEGEALHLAREWAGRTGQLVTVHDAAAPVAAGQRVWPCSRTGVLPAGPGQDYATALHGAAAGQLVAVLPDAQPAGPDRESISAQAHELRYVREHMRGVDPALPVSEIDRQE